MTINSQNAATLREARSTVAEFERVSGLTTEEMLSCAEGDERLSKIDPFDLMDWHYALDQITALSNVLDIMEAAASIEAKQRSCAFRYPRTNKRELTNTTEGELLLVA
ncbi:MAG TPA: hypothetical protein VIJ65_08780 [Acidobacteriaceae bacterium]